ncbi:unnamed protein product [Camellia sinensis]
MPKHRLTHPKARTNPTSTPSSLPSPPIPPPPPMASPTPLPASAPPTYPTASSSAAAMFPPTFVRTVYGLAQCTPDLNAMECDKCLREGISIFPSCCDGKQGGRILFPSCNVRYELYRFYNAAGTAPAPPPPVLLPPPPPPPPPPPASSPGNGGISSQVFVAIIVSIGDSVLLIIIGFCFMCRRGKKKHDAVESDIVGDEITSVQSLQFDLATIQVATNNFFDHNKIGQGGFGSVYKGILTNGQEIAVKRLSRKSGQGAEEFKNEAVLVAKLQHRNLVRLLRFCLEGEEKILIYEFVPNKSLDYFLFDPQEQEKLDWSRPYKITGGIAKGMLYFHEDSRLRIIHRDLKASNVLLDRDMNAKISDFGMARIFGVDQTQGNTSRVNGYMSPEYAMRGQFLTKSDVYSFGVLILKIISGKKNNTFYQVGSAEDLLSYAWKLWREERPLELMDSTLKRSYSRNEVIRCIHICLLCIQEDPDTRPSMATIVVKLNSYLATLSIPQQPAIFAHSRTESKTGQGLKSDQSTSVITVSADLCPGIIGCRPDFTQPIRSNLPSRHQWSSSTTPQQGQGSIRVQRKISEKNH